MVADTIDHNCLLKLRLLKQHHYFLRKNQQRNTRIGLQHAVSHMMVFISSVFIENMGGWVGVNEYSMNMPSQVPATSFSHFLLDYLVRISIFLM
jgi:hypothetical protein